MADFLIKIFKENDQPLPDFFKERAGEVEAKFDDDSGAESENEGGEDGGADPW